MVFLNKAINLSDSGKTDRKENVLGIEGFERAIKRNFTEKEMKEMTKSLENREAKMRIFLRESEGTFVEGKIMKGFKLVKMMTKSTSKVETMTKNVGKEKKEELKEQERIGAREDGARENLVEQKKLDEK